LALAVSAWTPLLIQIFYKDSALTDETLLAQHTAKLGALPALPALPALHVQALHVHLGARKILHDIDFSLAAGAVLGLVGPNGSGKSTLIRSIIGSLTASAGQLEIAGFDVQAAPLAARQNLGFAPDVNLLPAQLSVRQCLQLSAIARSGDARAAVPDATWQQAEQFALGRYFDSYIATLSLGTRQKVAVLIGLMSAPPLLVLDEVFNGLDPKSAYALKRILRELAAQGCAIILATHGLELAADLLSEMLLLSEGRVAAHWQSGAFAELRGQGGAGLEYAIVRALESDV
jgi:ABC-2 type transport system ATP-binding protein